MVESMESIKTAAVHADARAELANLLDKASEELAAGGGFIGWLLLKFMTYFNWFCFVFF